MNVRQQRSFLKQLFISKKIWKKKDDKKKTFILLGQVRFDTYKLKTKKQAK